MSDDYQIYVWGFRMGIYPNIELTFSFLEKNGQVYTMHEINQAQPRLVKNNLVFHKIKRVLSSYKNTALITEEGNLLLHGFNESNQMCLKPDIRDMVGFFPEFMPIDALLSYKIDDVAIGNEVIYAICSHKETKDKAVFAWGSN